MGFGKMNEIEGAFPNMFPHTQFLEEAEIKHGRMAMLAWTGVWATEGLGWHFPGAPQADDWTTGLGVWAREDPGRHGLRLDGPVQEASRGEGGAIQDCREEERPCCHDRHGQFVRNEGYSGISSFHVALRQLRH